MVRFVTTTYTHMYDNGYLGNPEEKYWHKSQDELTSVGIRVERWRKKAQLDVDGLVEQANEMLVREQRMDADTYWEFVRGQRRISNSQIRAIAKALGVTVYVMTHYSPGRVPEGGLPKAKKVPAIKVNEVAKRAERRKRSQGAPRPKPAPRRPQYDADEAARRLAEKFGDRVKRA